LSFFRREPFQQEAERIRAQIDRIFFIPVLSGRLTRLCIHPSRFYPDQYRARRLVAARSEYHMEASMDPISFKTYSARPSDIRQAWYVIDAENQVVGRLASRIATILRGKHKPQYTPHIDTGDFVIVVNADKVRFTGAKELNKQYFSHTGYPGGEKLRSPKEMREKKPTFLVENAVKGMLPKGPLGRSMLKKLKVYAGPDHPHAAQVPQELTLE
jgi:large subunit ribosomal protein L13